MVVNEVTNNTTDPQFAEANTRCDELLHYLAPFGKKLRGFITFIAYEVLEKPENLTPGNRRLAMLMAWALEIVSRVYLVIRTRNNEASSLFFAFARFYVEN
mgnify:FL=1